MFDELKENKSLISQEKNLIELAVSGEVSAFEALVKKHYQKAFNYALMLCRGNTAQAADLLQESLLKAFLNIRNFRGQASFSTWLWRILYNSFLDLKRRKTFGLLTEEVAANESQENDFQKEENSTLLNRYISEIRSPFKEVLILIDLLGNSYEEVAEITEVPVGTVRSRLSRARKELSEILWNKRELFDF